MAALAIVSMVAACGGETPQQNGKAPQQEIVAAPTIDAVLKAFKEKALPIEAVEIYTAETDPNKLLGRPNQYTGKANFVDSRHKDAGDSNAIEVFETAEAAKSRHDYVEQVTKDIPMLVQYLILSDRVLVRLDKALTPTEVDAYRAAITSNN